MKMVANQSGRGTMRPNHRHIGIVHIDQDSLDLAGFFLNRWKKSRRTLRSRPRPTQIIRRRLMSVTSVRRGCPFFSETSSIPIFPNRQSRRAGACAVESIATNPLPHAMRSHIEVAKRHPKSIIGRTADSVITHPRSMPQNHGVSGRARGGKCAVASRLKDARLPHGSGNLNL